MAIKEVLIEVLVVLTRLGQQLAFWHQPHLAPALFSGPENMKAALTGRHKMEMHSGEKSNKYNHTFKTHIWINVIVCYYMFIAPCVCSQLRKNGPGKIMFLIFDKILGLQSFVRSNLIKALTGKNGCTFLVSSE